MTRSRSARQVAFCISAMLLGACSVASPAPTETVTSTATLASISASTQTSAAPRPPTETPVVAPISTFSLTSAAFEEGGAIPTRHTYSLGGQCSGENFSPPLSWAGVSPNARSLVLIVTDPDGGNWVHWVLFNIPADATQLSEAVGGPDVGVKGKNDFGELGYGGPCPPAGTHRYIFALYALDTMLDLPEGVTKATVDAAMENHVIGQARLSGLRAAP